MSRQFFPVSLPTFRTPTFRTQTSSSALARRSKKKLDIIHSVRHSVLQPVAKQAKSYAQRGIRQPSVIGAGLWLALLAWDWPLAVAIAAGTGGAIAVYLYQLGRLNVTWFDRFSKTDSVLSRQQYWQGHVEKAASQLRQIVQHQWPRCWRDVNRPLTFAVFIGLGITSIVATIAFTYRDLHSLSLSLAMGLQLLVVGGLGTLMGWTSLSPVKQLPTAETQTPDGDVTETSATYPSQSNPSQNQQTPAQTIDQLWADLTAKDTTTRLIAIYRSIHWVESAQVSSSKQTALSQQAESMPGPSFTFTGMDATKLTACMRVMLSNESNPTVQKALRDGLMTLQQLSNTQHVTHNE